jgi:hypothetical protein
MQMSTTTKVIVIASLLLSILFSLSDLVILRAAYSGFLLLIGFLVLNS